MAQGIVHVLEMVEIHQQHCDRRPFRRRGRELLVETLGKQRAVGECCQRVAIREVHDARFARDQTLLHGTKGVGERADLVRATCGRHGRIVPGGDAASDARKLTHRPHDAACDHQAGDDRDYDRERRNHGELTLQTSEGLQRRGEGLLQDGDDRLAVA